MTIDKPAPINAADMHALRGEQETFASSIGATPEQLATVQRINAMLFEAIWTAIEDLGLTPEDAIACAERALQLPKLFGMLPVRGQFGDVTCA